MQTVTAAALGNEWYESVARGKKAAKLASVFRSINASGIDVSDLPDMSWEMAAEIAKVRIPSHETRAVVIGILSADGDI